MIEKIIIIIAIVVLLIIAEEVKEAGRREVWRNIHGSDDDYHNSD